MSYTQSRQILLLNKGRKKRNSPILTDTPEKNAIEEEYQLRNNAKKKFSPHDTEEGKKKMKGKVKRKTQRRQIKGKENKSDDEDCFCLVCLESFGNSRSNEQWIIQCIE
ncbi:hypothetical protein WA026_022462 [Henosepilachna vigintioctopunctata]|uniref:Uncharacterized protein n=1 Tax=Henosepilachna vigintioctopunctata TaxID=420089 RepID=A0AAW1TPH3_9CUCU